MRTRPPGPFAGLTPVLRPHVRYRRERSGALLFDALTLEVYATNPTGLAILRKIDQRACCSQILARLHRRFPAVPRCTLLRGLRAFLQRLENAGLLDLKAPPARSMSSRVK